MAKGKEEKQLYILLRIYNVDNVMVHKMRYLEPSIAELRNDVEREFNGPFRWVGIPKSQWETSKLK